MQRIALLMIVLCTACGAAGNSAYPAPALTESVATATADYYAAPIDWQNPIPLKYGETIFIHDGGLRISFVEVTEDSRCPYAEGVTCKWEGNAQVRLRLKRVGGVEMDLVLNTNNRLARSGTYSGYDVYLQTVEPDLAKIIKPAKEDYVVWLAILKI